MILKEKFMEQMSIKKSPISACLLFTLVLFRVGFVFFINVNEPANMSALLFLFYFISGS